jgi:hypothetical protein
MSHWNDFNDADPQAGFDLIPKGTLVQVRMTIKPGGIDDAEQGWLGGWATASNQTGSVYLSAEFAVLHGPYAKRKLWSNIGLYSPKSDEWANMGRSFIRAALNSARGIAPKDMSEQAKSARHIEHFGELDGLVFVGRVDVEKDSNGELKNILKQAIEPDHKAYTELMVGAESTGSVAPPARALSNNAAAPSASAAKSPFVKPDWAQ